MLRHLKTPHVIIALCVGIALGASKVPRSTILPYALWVFAICIMGFIFFVTVRVVLFIRDTKIASKMLESGHYDEAVALYSNLKLQIKPPGNYAQLFNLAVAHHRKGDLQTALAVLNEVDATKLPPTAAARYH